MATTFETSETFNEPMDRLCETLLANLNKEDGLFETHWAAAHAEELTLENGQQVRHIWGITSAFDAPGDIGAETRYLHFRVQCTALSATGTKVQVLVVSPHPRWEVSTEIAPWMSSHENPRLQKIADKVLELCANPHAETDVSRMSWFKKLLGQTQGKGKRKTGENVIEE